MITSRMHQEKILYMMKWIPFKRNYTRLGKLERGGEGDKNEDCWFCTFNSTSELPRVCDENAFILGL